MSESKPRVAMVGMASENCTFSLARTEEDDFEVLRGEALARRRYPFIGDEGMTSASFLPLVHARALPGGMITERAYQTLKSEILSSLKAEAPLQGVYLDLHGAMHVEGLWDAEVDLVSAIRDVVGNDVLLGASMDLHGNVSRRLVDLVDLFSAYRTAPHIDTEATRQRVCRLMAQTLAAGGSLQRAWVPIPVLLPGEMTSTLDEPGRGLYEGLTDFDGGAGILDVSLWVGYVWADVRRVADAVARRYWEAREDFRFNVPAGDIGWVLDQAIEEPRRPVVVSDSGDNPTAGGVGDLPLALGEVSEREVFQSGAKQALVVGIWDAQAVEACRSAGEGTELELIVGPDCDRRHSEPVSVRGRVKRLFDGDAVAGWQAVVAIGDGITAVLTERRKPFHHFSDFHQLGLQPEEADVVVVKIGYLVTDLQALASTAYLALTPGAVNQHVTRVKYEHLERPMFPFDTDFDWEPRAMMVR